MVLEHKLGQVFGIGLGFSHTGTIETIYDTTLTKHEDFLTETFSVDVNFSLPEKGRPYTYNEEDILKKANLGALPVYRIEQTSDILKRNLYISTPRSDNKTIIIIEHTLTTEELTWTLSGTVVTEDGTQYLDLGRTKLRVLTGNVIDEENPGKFRLTNGKNTTVFEIETLPLYEEIENTLFVVNTTQVAELLASAAFFTEHKLLPVVVLDLAEEKEILQSLQAVEGGKSPKADTKHFIRKKEDLYQVIKDLRPKNIVVLTPTIDELAGSVITNLASKMKARVYLVHEMYKEQKYDEPHITVYPSKNFEETVNVLAQIFHEPEIDYLSVENAGYFPAACVLSRLLGKELGKVIIPVQEPEPEHELSIGTKSYGNGAFCNDLVTVTGSILEKMGAGEDENEGVIVELDSNESLMRSIIGANYAYMRKTVPVPVSVDLDIGHELKELFDSKSYPDTVKNKLKQIDWEGNALSVLSSIIDIDYEFNKELSAWNTYFQVFAENIREDIDKLQLDEALHNYICQAISEPLSSEELSKAIENNPDNDVKFWCKEEYDVRAFEQIVTTVLPEKLPERYEIFLSWRKLRDRITRVLSELITSSIGYFAPLFNKQGYKFLTAFTSATPYNLVKENGKYWAAKYAIGHFLEQKADNTSVALINSFLYTSGRKNPISTVFIVSPFEKMDHRGIHTICKRASGGHDNLSSTDKIHDAAGYYWSLALSLKNDESNKDFILELANTIDWAEIHFSTHGNEDSIFVKGGERIEAHEIRNLDLRHSMLGMNACDSYHSTGKKMLSTLAYGGYVTLFPVDNTVADAIGYKIFQGDMAGEYTAVSLQKTINSLMMGDGLEIYENGSSSFIKKGETLTELAYIFVGLPTSRIYARELHDSQKVDVNRYRYDYFFGIVNDWIEKKRVEPGVLVEKFMALSDEYEREVGFDKKQLSRIYNNNGVVVLKVDKFEEAAQYFEKALQYTDDSLHTEKAEIISNCATASIKTGDLSAFSLRLSDLAEMARAFPADPEINFALAKGLYNIITVAGDAGDLSTSSSHISDLAEVARAFPADREINLKLAKGLYNISLYYDTAGNLSTSSSHLSDLTEVACAFSDDWEINMELAKGLVNIIVVYGNDGNLSTSSLHLSALAEVARSFPTNREINLKLAEGLCNISLYYGAAGNLSISSSHISDLAEVARAFPADPEINFALAKGLYNIITVAGDAGDLSTSSSHISDLAEVARAFPADREINLKLAKGLYNISLYYGTAGNLSTSSSHLSDLTEVACAFSDDWEINMELAKGLYDISSGYGAVGDLLTSSLHLSALAEVAHSFPVDREINLKLAKGLYNISLDYGAAGDLSTSSSHLSALAEVAHSFPVDREINLKLAKGLYNISLYYGAASNFSTSSSHLSALAEVARAFSDDREINMELAGVLYDIITVACVASDFSTSSLHIPYLAEVARAFPADPEINFALAKGLYNISLAHIKSGDLSTSPSHLFDLAEVARAFPANREINLKLAEGLYNISLYHGAAGDLSTSSSHLSDLAEVARSFPADTEINLILAKGFAAAIITSLKSNKEEHAAPHLKELENIATRFIEHMEIQDLYDEILLDYLKETKRRDRGNIY